MRNAPSSYQIAPRETAEFAAGALFVDLDYTFFNGIAVGMSEDEIAAAPLDEGVLAKIHQAHAAGVPVVMVTRNDESLIEKFFRAKPETRALFTETLACPAGNKSDVIKAWLKAHNLPEDAAAFVDDTAQERDDVERNVEGAQVVAPERVHDLRLERVHRTRGQVAQLFPRAPFATDADDVLLAA